MCVRTIHDVFINFAGNGKLSIYFLFLKVLGFSNYIDNYPFIFQFLPGHGNRIGGLGQLYPAEAYRRSSIGDLGGILLAYEGKEAGIKWINKWINIH